MTWQEVFPQFKVPHLIKVPALVHTPVHSWKAQYDSAQKTQKQRLFSNQTNKNGFHFPTHPDRDKYYSVKWQVETAAF